MHTHSLFYDSANKDSGDEAKPSSSRHKTDCSDCQGWFKDLGNPERTQRQLNSKVEDVSTYSSIRNTKSGETQKPVKTMCQSDAYVRGGGGGVTSTKRTLTISATAGALTFRLSTRQRTI
jgi:hypothetical protein